MPSISPDQKRFFRIVYDMQQGKRKKSGKAGKAANTMNPTTVKHFLEEKSVSMNKIKEIIKSLKELRYDTTGTSFSGNPSPVEPMYLNELDTTSEPDPISNQFNQELKNNENFDSFVNTYTGLPMKPKEKETFQNIQNIKAISNKFDPNAIEFSNTDKFGATTKTVIKKLRDPNSNNIVFVGFQEYKNQNVPNTNEAVSPPPFKAAKTQSASNNPAPVVKPNTTPQQNADDINNDANADQNSEPDADTQNIEKKPENAVTIVTSIPENPNDEVKSSKILADLLNKII